MIEHPEPGLLQSMRVRHKHFAIKASPLDITTVGEGPRAQLAGGGSGIAVAKFVRQRWTTNVY